MPKSTNSQNSSQMTLKPEKMERKFTILRTVIILLFTLATSRVQALELSVILSKTLPEGPWQVDYVFSQPVSEISFERTPYAFVESAWSVRSEGAALELSSLKVVFDRPAKVLTTEIHASYDQPIRGFYTPFLNFSDSSRALFIAHYFPSQVKLDNEWVSVGSIVKRLTIEATGSEKLWLSESDEIKNRELTMQDLRQYAYVGNLNVQHMGKFDLILDPKLPRWVKDAYSNAAIELLTYYQSKTNASLAFKPFFLINFKPGPERARIDGGAINKQVAINMVGDGWQQNPEQNLINVLSLMAHEIAHLWNSQYWIATEDTPIWMFEGGANYFSQKALLNMGYITTSDYWNNILEKSDACGRTLSQHPFDRLPNRLDYYVCGEAFYYIADSMLGNPKGLELWNFIVGNSPGDSYTQKDFINALTTIKVSADDIGKFKAILLSEGQEFYALSDKYLQGTPTEWPVGERKEDM